MQDHNEPAMRRGGSSTDPTIRYGAIALPTLRLGEPRVPCCFGRGQAQPPATRGPVDFRALDEARRMTPSSLGTPHREHRQHAVTAPIPGARVGRPEVRAGGASDVIAPMAPDLPLPPVPEPPSTVAIPTSGRHVAQTTESTGAIRLALFAYASMAAVVVGSVVYAVRS